MKARTSPSRRAVRETRPAGSGLRPAPGAEMELRRVLVPVDFSDCSHKAFRYGVLLARRFNAEITLLHVFVPDPAPLPPQTGIPEGTRLTVEYQKKSAERFAEWRAEIVPPLRLKTVLCEAASVHEEIVTTAREMKTDLVIVGNRGRTGLSRMLLGSTAEQVVRHAPCPVLVIRAREHDFVQV